MSSERDDALLEVRGLSRSYPGVRALADVDFEVRAGEVVALVGHNGSGKSTLVKVLSGIVEPDAGARIALAGTTQVHVIHQDLGLVDGLSTVENLALGAGLGRGALRPTRRRAERARARELIARFGARFDVAMPVGRLTSAERTVVALARALEGWEHPRQLLVLDEPTATLHGDESTQLFEAVRRVRADGAGIVFVSHRLEEVLALADRIVVLRDGRVVTAAPRSELDHDELVRLVAGGDVRTVARTPPPATRPGTGALVVRGLRGATVRGVDLEVAAGEVVGVTGLVGSGSETLCSLVFGAERREAGTVAVAGKPVTASSPAAAIRLRVGFVPADRRTHGGVMTHTARENLTLPDLRGLRRALGRLDGRAERAEAADWAQRVGLVPADPERPLGLFSGGNQQKVVLARWLRTRPAVLLLDEPTQGVDVGAQGQIHALVRQAAADGAAVLASSSDTKELLALCDRVVVLADGELVADLAGAELDEVALIRASLGPGAPAVTLLPDHHDAPRRTT